jgi:hypothetical protein
MVEHCDNPDVVYETCTENVKLHWPWGTTTEGTAELVELLKKEKKVNLLQMLK